MFLFIENRPPTSPCAWGKTDAKTLKIIRIYTYQFFYFFIFLKKDLPRRLAHGGRQTPRR